jgi:hypothetical protein
MWSVESQPTFRRYISPQSSGSKNKLSKKPAWKQVASRAFRPWRWRRYVPPKRRLTFNGLHGVIYVFENIVLFVSFTCYQNRYSVELGITLGNILCIRVVSYKRSWYLSNFGIPGIMYRVFMQWLKYLPSLIAQWDFIPSLVDRWKGCLLNDAVRIIQRLDKNMQHIHSGMWTLYWLLKKNLVPCNY